MIEKGVEYRYTKFPNETTSRKNSSFCIALEAIYIIGGIGSFFNCNIFLIEMVISSKF